MEDFKSLGVTQFIVDTLTEVQITKPTCIQTKAVPAILGGSSVIGELLTRVLRDRKREVLCIPHTYNAKPI